MPFTGMDSRQAELMMSESQSSSASLRSRRSFRERTTFWFNRSKSTVRQAREISPSPPTNSTDEVAHLRPQTARSTQSSRRKTEALETIRSSVLGGFRTDSPPVPRDHVRAGSSASSSLARADSVASSGRETFQKEDEYYKHLRKQSISPPFNFEHVTHTAKTQLPPLETVDEQDLPRQFWSVSARQRPKRHLNGIQAEDIPRQHQSSDSESSNFSTPNGRPVSPLTASELGDEVRHILTPIEQLSNLDEQIFDAVASTRPNTLNRSRSVRSRSNSGRSRSNSGHHPRRYSSLNALRPGVERAESSETKLATFYESESPELSTDDENGGAKRTGDAVAAAPVPAPQQQDTVEQDVAYRSMQPLPPIPTERASKRFSQAFILPAEVGRVPSIAVQLPAEHAWSPGSQHSSVRSSEHSSRSSRSLHKSLSQSSSTGVRQSTILSDTTWEDDVDYCYEQEAESTCHFNWGSTPRQSNEDDDDGLMLMTQSYHAHSPAVSVGSGPQARANASKETIAERRRSRRFEDSPRAPSSVGHRGFLAARRSSQEVIRIIPTPIQMTPSFSTPNLLSAVSSFNSHDEQKPTATSALHDSGVGSLSSRFLSDAASHRSSSSTRHTKSSSHGSSASSAQASSKPSRDTGSNRWSVASSTSVPDYMHSGRNKLILSKTIVSAPLESLPQSPPYELDAENANTAPRDFQSHPPPKSFAVRRGDSPGDRAVLKNGAKMATKRDSSQPGTGRYRYSQALQPSTGVFGGAAGWI